MGQIVQFNQQWALNVGCKVFCLSSTHTHCSVPLCYCNTHSQDEQILLHSCSFLFVCVPHFTLSTTLKNLFLSRAGFFMECITEHLNTYCFFNQQHACPGAYPIVDKVVEYISANCRTICLLFSKAQGQREARNQWNPCLSMSYIVFFPFQRNNGEHASKGPCRPGFSQSFYSVLISRDVLQGQGIGKGKTCNWRDSSIMFCLEALHCEENGSLHWGWWKDIYTWWYFLFNARPWSFFWKRESSIYACGKDGGKDWIL